MEDSLKKAHILEIYYWKFLSAEDKGVIDEHISYTSVLVIVKQ